MIMFKSFNFVYSKALENIKRDNKLLSRLKAIESILQDFTLQINQEPSKSPNSVN